MAVTLNPSIRLLWQTPGQIDWHPFTYGLKRQIGRRTANVQMSCDDENASRKMFAYSVVP